MSLPLIDNFCYISRVTLVVRTAREQRRGLSGRVTGTFGAVPVAYGRQRVFAAGRVTGLRVSYLRSATRRALFPFVAKDGHDDGIPPLIFEKTVLFKPRLLTHTQ